MTLSLTRRALLGATGGVTLASAVPVLGGGRPAHALVEATGGQAPGFFRFRVGDFDVLSVSDGSLTLEPMAAMMPNAPADEMAAIMAAHGRPTDRLFGATNALLVNTGDHRVLVDAGSGEMFQPTAGRLEQNLAAAGIMAEDIDAIVFTHAHPDHAWGIIDTATASPRFPNATYYMRETEWGFWMSPDTLSSAPDAIRGMIQTTQDVFQPVADRVELLAADAEVVPGVFLAETPGHTPGHVGIRVSSGDQQLFCTGDCMVSDILHFRHPEWHFAFDMDPDQAVTTRRRVFDEVSADGIPVIGFHFTYPGVGYVMRDGGAYRWVAAQWFWDE